MKDKVAVINRVAQIILEMEAWQLLLARIKVAGYLDLYDEILNNTRVVRRRRRRRSK